MSAPVRAAVARASRTVTPVWPLSSFIAVNPLAAREGEPFDTVAPMLPLEHYRALHRSGRITRADLAAVVRERLPESAALEPLSLGGERWGAAELLIDELIEVPAPAADAPEQRRADLVDELTARWLAAFLDTHALWPMPERENGFWAAWRSVAPRDPQLPGRVRVALRDLPADPAEALDAALTRLGIPEDDRRGAFARELASQPGWAAHVRWRSERGGEIDVTSYLAMRFTLRAELGLPLVDGTPTAPTVSPWERADALAAVLGITLVDGERAVLGRLLALHPVEAHAGTWQAAFERHYRAALLRSLPSAPVARRTPAVQFVACIDPRSEGLRRHLETDPAIETIGFAGFFGVPIRFAKLAAHGSVDSLPALLSPKHSVTERPVDARRARRHLAGARARAAASAALHAAEASPLTGFALAETAGWVSGARAAARTLWPSGRVAESSVATRLTMAEAFTLEERAALAETAIRMMGLDVAAPLIVLTGHGSTTTNNLYQSALDCGACGGHAGGVNARAAAALFNDPEVREVLAERGVGIPESTWVVAALHDTTLDRVTVLDRHLIPVSHTAQVASFEASARAAGNALIIERRAQLPGGRRASVRRLRRRAHDWSEVFPELGLAGNAAMIIAPREATRGVDLGRRVFLHSYRPELDPQGSGLETIMTAPLIVAQWINHQYYFSTVEPARYGAGTKTIHNAIGTVGVVSGRGGDLRIGLPQQSIAAGERPLHEPLRLSVLVQAPLETVGSIVHRNQVLRNLVENGWITLHAREHGTAPWQRYGAYGWEPATEPRPTLVPAPAATSNDNEKVEVA